MSPSSKSSSTHTINFKVFLSFLGQDTCRNFVSHLRGSLDRKGYTTTELKNDPSRDESDPSVVDRAIGESKVAVVVISEKYASSPCSLESLVRIMGFHHSGSLAVIPVFYEIDPYDVRSQSGKLWEPFSSHERENPAKVQTWRQTLSQLEDIPGDHYSEIWKGDAELIGKITDDIWDILIGSKAVDFCGLVGMDRHMKAMYGLLDFRSRFRFRWFDEVRLIQIVGKQGIGKTELAKYTYEEISHHFDTHLWLDVRDDRHYGGRDLAEKLEFDLSKSIQGSHRQRVLLVLDNVDEMYSIDGIERSFRLFGPGSTVIVVATRKMQNLGSIHGIYLGYDYEVVGLEFSEALQLFCFHAFEQTHLSLGFEDLSSRAVKLTGGCPATIKELGSGLSGRDRKEWEAILSDYESKSYKGIIGTDKIRLSKQSSGRVSSQSSSTSQSSTTSNSHGLVGMDCRMQAVTQLLELGSDKEVRVVGIWGTGGIGKTTLARYAYEGISQQFHTHVFLGNAQDHNSSFCLEERFLSKAMEREAFAVRNSKDGLDVMKSGLRHHKVLLIVDGVENNKALEDIQKMTVWFHPGSRIVVTTRDESLLLANGVKHAYEVKCLRLDEALQLFYHFALKQKSPSDYFKQLSVRAIKLVGFRPLALKVTASMLFGEDMNSWETILQSLEAKQDKGMEVSAK